MIFFFFLRKALVFSATLFRSTRQVDLKLEMGCIFKGHFKVEYLMLSTRDPLQNKGHIQTKSEGLEKNIPCKRRPKESRSCNTHIR